MLLKFATLGAVVSSQDVGDDTTLLQLSTASVLDNRNSDAPSPLKEAMAAVTKSHSPTETSLIVKELTEKAVRGEVTIDDSAKEALYNMKTTLAQSEELIKEQHNTDQALRDSTSNTAGNCQTNYESAKQEDNIIGNAVGDKHDSHVVCRNALKELDDDMKTKCTALTNYITGLTPPTCTVPDRNGMENYFAGLKGFVDNNYQTWKDKNDACVAAETARENKDQECDTIQGQYETNFCSYRLEMYTTCSEYIGCSNNGREQYDAVMISTARGEQSRKIEWVAIKKIVCYIDVLISDDENDARKEALDACQALDPNTDHLTLTDPGLDDPESCNLNAVAEYPCTDGFTTNQYSGMIDLLDCQTCPPLPAHIDIENGHICAPFTDTHESWSNTKHGTKDGKTFIGPFDHGQRSVTKVFQLVPNVQYKWSVVMDTWGSVDNEQMYIKANDKKVQIQTRGAGDCHNGWTHYEYGYGRSLGSGGSGIHNWQDCWKAIETTITTPADGKVSVEMYMAIDQHLNDEGWGWHDMKWEPVNCPPVSKKVVNDDCSGWSIDKVHDIDGICYNGAFDNSQKTITKDFEGLTAGCTYKWSAVIDTWASVDNEQMRFTVNGAATTFQSRSHNSCNNGWTEYPNDFGDKVGSHGSHHGGWKDCWKNFETSFVAPASGKASIEMYMAIDQHINDEGWGWHSMKFERTSCPSSGSQQDDCEGWSVDKKHDVDGTCYMGAFDNNNQKVTKTFTGLRRACTYKWSAVIDTWASVDNEAMRFSVNGEQHNFQSRSAGSCNNGWTEYPNDFGDKVGSHGSSNGGWKDCWKNFEATFVVPNDGKANVEMDMAIDQHINDEGWGWHDMKFDKLSCPSSSNKVDDCEGWSVDKKHDVDGTCFMGAFDNSQRTVSKTFTGLSSGCTYTWKAVIDTWASVDNEAMRFTVNGQQFNFQSRSHNSCNNGWTEYPNDFGDKVGSHGSSNGGWKDCWKNFEAEFVAPADGKANVEMYMAIDQHINDEGWGWHDMEFVKGSCR